MAEPILNKTDTHKLMTASITIDVLVWVKKDVSENDARRVGLKAIENDVMNIVSLDVDMRLFTRFDPQGLFEEECPPYNNTEAKDDRDLEQIIKDNGGWSRNLVDSLREAAAKQHVEERGQDPHEQPPVKPLVDNDPD